MGWKNFNIDATVFEVKVIGSMVIHDSEGRFLGASIRKFQETMDPSVLELISIQEALSWVKDRGR